MSIYDRTLREFEVGEWRYPYNEDTPVETEETTVESYVRANEYTPIGSSKLADQVVPIQVGEIYMDIDEKLHDVWED